jgi:molybdopterin synthase catalytic subunit
VVEGVRRQVRVQAEDFEPGTELAALTAGDTSVGGLAVFVGLVRDQAEQRSVSTLTLEHYPGMTERQLESIAEAAEQRWPLRRLLIIHRYGRLLPGDRIVLVACTSAHREAAFDACRFLMDWLKTSAPFWKLEEGEGREEWVAAKDIDKELAERWAGR